MSMSTTINPISKKTKLSSKIEERLLSTKKYRQSWWIILAITLLFFAITAGVLAMQFVTYDDQLIMAVKQQNTSYCLASQILVYISYGILAIPYLYVAGAWMSGVNNISRSKTLHLTLWIIYSICMTIALIALILSIISIIKI